MSTSSSYPGNEALQIATPIHNHSHYSFPTGRDGLSKPEQIRDRCLELGFEACAITDHDVVAGHVDFYKTMSEAGIKPILGIEAYQAPKSRRENAGKQRIEDERVDNYHLVLLAQNNTGLRNLWAMNSESHETGFWYHGRVDWELLQKYNEGIIATSACGLSMLNWAIRYDDPDAVLRRYLRIFGDRFFIELHTYPEPWQQELNVELVRLARNHGIPMVYANDAHYAWKEQHDLHEAVIALALNTKVDDPNKLSHTPDLYIMDEEDTRGHLDYLPRNAVEEAIKNSDLIASMCDVTLPERRNRIPIFMPDKEYKNSKDMFYELAVDGYMRKIAPYPEKDQEVYMERFEKEMKVMFEANLYDYFLIVRDYIQAAKNGEIVPGKNMLIGPGRGSAGGSLVAYLLGITSIDPIRYGLIFERFYNAGRETGLPDIDTDFPVQFREAVKEYIAQKYGHEYVASLATVGQMQPKMSINDMARVLGVPMMESKKITAILDNSIKQGLQAESWDEIEEELGEQLAPYEEKYPQLFEYAKQLHHQIRTYGVHASGVIIGDEPLAETFPLKWNAKQEKMVTQFDMDIAGDLGFMKMDILGLRNLDTLDEVNNILIEEGRDPIDYDALQYMEHDESMWEMLDKGLTVGIFQIEDGGLAKQIARELKPRSIDELAVVVAMNRPGPIGDGALEKYVNGKNGGEVYYAHPYLAEVLAETHGAFLFQEQVINFMTKIGYNLFEADDVRSIMGKKKIEKVRVEFERYLPKALNHMDEATAREIWDSLVNFSRYGFNKSHAVGYAIITLQTLYAKWYDPTVFTLAAIRTVDKDDLARYINEAQRMKIRVLPPHINLSDVQIKKLDDAIIYGFNNIKGVGLGPARWLVEHQPYLGVADFLEKVQTHKQPQPNGQMRVALNIAHTRSLICLGAFGEEAAYDHKIKKDTYEHMTKLQDNELLDLEEELLGVALSDQSATILDEHKAEIDSTCVSFDDITEPGEYTVSGIIREFSESKTKKGDAMYYVTIENEGQTIRCAVWSNVYKRLDFIFRRRQAGIFLVKADKDMRLSLTNARALFRRNLQNDKRQALIAA